jgi:hypothetical protein
MDTAMLKIELTENEIAFVAAYVEAIDFTDTGDTDQPEAGCDLDEDFYRESVIDCLSFYSRICCYLNSETGTLSQAAHDFWFSRNGHGTGFWDRPEVYGEYLCDMLHKRAEGYGQVDAIFDFEE